MHCSLSIIARKAQRRPFAQHGLGLRGVIGRIGAMDGPFMYKKWRKQGEWRTRRAACADHHAASRAPGTWLQGQDRDRAKTIGQCAQTIW